MKSSPDSNIQKISKAKLKTLSRQTPDEKGFSEGSKITKRVASNSDRDAKKNAKM